MTVYVHFNPTAPGTKPEPVKQHNVCRVEDLGDSTVLLVNAFGGEPRRFEDVSHLAVQPERE